MMNTVGPFNKWIIIVLLLVAVLLCECYQHSNVNALFSQPTEGAAYQGAETTHNINQDFEHFQIKSVCK